MAARLRDALAGWLRWAADRLVPAAEAVVEERSLPGAPEHWLSLVRDRAPHLLRPAKVLSVAAAASVRAAPAPPPADETPVRWTGVAVAVSAAAPPPARRVSIEDTEPPRPAIRLASTHDVEPFRPEIRRVSTEDTEPSRPAVRLASTQDVEPSRPEIRQMSTEDTEPPRPEVRLRPAAPEPVRSPAPRRLPEPAEAPAVRPAPAPQEDRAPLVRPVPEDDTAPRTKPAVRVDAAPRPGWSPAPMSVDREEPAWRPAGRAQHPGTPGRGPVVLRWPDLPDSARAAWTGETPPDEVAPRRTAPHHADAPPRRHRTTERRSELPEVAEHVVRSGPWPRLGNETHRRWPELPDDSAQWEVTPRRGGDRIRRLDEEQRGLPWNA
ncbi:hypothetical protein AB0J72_30750 [Dactylosporangium sp. NPDC049742]|uniref:hypothetical protein n=1 Tax=Dactylosporangium sp. NPDC049742 TaxID=3154737 RepID=UPI0034184E85